MVSYYNTLPYSQKHSAANLAYSAGQPWQWPTNYHTPPNHQFLSEMDSPQPHHHMYYNPHHMFHTTPSAASDWHTPASAADNFATNAQTVGSSHHHMLQQHHANVPVSVGSNSSTSSTGSASVTAVALNSAGNTNLNDTVGSIGEQHIAEALPSPPITVSAGSEISSPGAPASSSPHHITHHHNNNNNNNNNSSNNTTANNLSQNNNNNNNSNRSSPVKAQYYDWMKKPSYPAQPTPGKTRTKDKYRVVYTDFQRLELEKEYCTSRYITIRRKTELAQSLSLSERQVKIWFQNRRAKERKQNKKGSDSTVIGAVQHAEYANLMDTKPKLEPGLHLQHSLHSMAAMSMPSMSLHHHLHSHHPLAAHQLHQPSHAQISAAAALSM